LHVARLNEESHVAQPRGHGILNALVAAVWLVNGLFAKVLNLAPRHREIVAEILGPEHAVWMTPAIGGGEVLLCVWILTGRWRRGCAVTQIVLVATMNVLEVFLVPEHLLWGRWNAVFAVAFMGAVYWNGFHHRRPKRLK
jgi:uncharacterized membrane protein YphA (DoxX/SURF4 family)